MFNYIFKIFLFFKVLASKFCRNLTNWMEESRRTAAASSTLALKQNPDPVLLQPGSKNLSPTANHGVPHLTNKNLEEVLPPRRYVSVQLLLQQLQQVAVAVAHRLN